MNHWVNPWAFIGLVPALFVIGLAWLIWKQRLWRYQWFHTEEINVYPNTKFIIRIIGICLLIVAAAGPYITLPLENRNQQNIWFLLDISESMNSSDILPSRFEKAKSQILAITESTPQSSVGLILFSSAPYVQVPLTSDRQVFKELTLLAYSAQIEGKGTHIRKALQQVADRIELANIAHAQVVVFTDGDDYGENFQSQIERLQNLKAEIIWVGCGDKKNNQPQVIPFQEQNIKKWANLSQATYLDIQQEDFHRLLQQKLSQLSIRQEEALKQQNNIYYYPLGLAWILLYSLLFLKPRFKSFSHTSKP